MDTLYDLTRKVNALDSSQHYCVGESEGGGFDLTVDFGEGDELYEIRAGSFYSVRDHLIECLDWQS